MNNGDSSPQDELKGGSDGTAGESIGPPTPINNSTFPETKFCRTCGTAFIPKYKHAKYCQPGCRQSAPKDKANLTRVPVDVSVLVKTGEVCGIHPGFMTKNKQCSECIRLAQEVAQLSAVTQKWVKGQKVQKGHGRKNPLRSMIQVFMEEPDKTSSIPRMAWMVQKIYDIAINGSSRDAIDAFQALAVYGFGKPAPSEEELTAMEQQGIKIVVLPQLPTKQEKSNVPLLPDFIEGEIVPPEDEH